MCRYSQNVEAEEHLSSLFIGNETSGTMGDSVTLATTPTWISESHWNVWLLLGRWLNLFPVVEWLVCCLVAATCSNLVAIWQRRVGGDWTGADFADLWSSFARWFDCWALAGWSLISRRGWPLSAAPAGDFCKASGSWMSIEWSTSQMGSWQSAVGGRRWASDSFSPFFNAVSEVAELVDDFNDGRW